MTCRIAAVLAGLLCLPAIAQAASLTVEVQGVRDAAGRVFVCLFSRPSGFPDCAADQNNAIHASLPSRTPSTVFRFDSLSPGIYAASAFHDERGTGRLDTSLLGIPREGVGVSRDAPARFGPPSFADAAFTIDGGDAAISLRLVYP